VDVEIGPNRLTVRMPSHGARPPGVGARVQPVFLAQSLRVLADA